MLRQEKHTYLLATYFMIHSLSLFVHEIGVYVTYELLFLLALIYGVKYILRKESAKRIVFQSLWLHVALTVLYAFTLFFIQQINIASPLAMLVFYPFVHLLMSIVVYTLAWYFGVKRNFVV